MYNIFGQFQAISELAMSSSFCLDLFQSYFCLLCHVCVLYEQLSTSPVPGWLILCNVPELVSAAAPLCTVCMEANRQWQRVQRWIVAD